MSKILFFGVPAHGHTNPSLGLVRELVARGVTVIYYSFPEFRGKVECAGAEYRLSPGAELGERPAAQLNRLSFLYQQLVQVTEREIATFIDIIRMEKPDCIIHDSLAAWGKFAALLTDTPAIASSTTFLFRQQSISLRSLLSVLGQIRWKDMVCLHAAAKSARAIRRRYQIKDTGFLAMLCQISPLTIVYTLRELQPQGESFDPDQFKFIGASITLRENEPCEPDYASLKQPLVYISFGTIQNQQLSFYKKVLTELADFPGTVVLSVGNETHLPSLGVPGAHIVIRARVNQMAVLACAAAFVTHGGMNSVHEALSCGVPLVAVPFHEEQRTVARQVAATGCGLYLARLNAGLVRRAISRVLIEDSFQLQAQKYSGLLQASGGVHEAVDAIMAYKSRVRPN